MCVYVATYTYIKTEEMITRQHVFQGRAQKAQREQQRHDELGQRWASIPDMGYICEDQLVELLNPRSKPSRNGKICDPWDALIGPPNKSHKDGDTQGTRCMAAVEHGITMEDIVKYYPNLATGTRNNLQTAISAYERRLSMARTKMVCWIFQGATQTGKTTMAYNMAMRLTGTTCIDEAQFTLTKIGKGSSGQSWFDGYKRQKVLVLDEYRGDEYSCTDLLNWLNPRRPCILPIKGGTTWANWEYVFITTNNDIDTWREPTGHAYTDENRAALMGRINYVYTFKTKTDIVKQKLAPLVRPKEIVLQKVAEEDISEIGEFYR